MKNLINFSNVRKTYYYLKKNGWKEAYLAAAERLLDSRNSYEYEEPSGEELKRQQTKEWKEKVKISVIVPVYRTPSEYLRQMIESLKAQTYPFWELILADAGMDEEENRRVRETVEHCQDARIVYRKLDRNGGISENTNRGIESAEGAYIGLLDHDDTLTPDALFWMAEELEKRKEQGKETAFLYSDEDKCSGDGKNFFEPHFKPDFNLDLLLSNNYVCHFLVMKAELMKQLLLRREYDGAQDYDLVLRATGTLMAEGKRPENCIGHVGKVLYHWRCHENSTSSNPASKTYAYDAGKRALRDFLSVWMKKNAEATDEIPQVTDTRHLGFYRIHYGKDIFKIRPDLGALAFPFPEKGKMIQSGIYETDGNMRYAELKKGFGGYMHRAVLQQDVETADIRFMKVRPEFVQEWEKEQKQLLDRLSEREKSGSSREERQKEAFYISRRFCEKLRAQGYRILWDPQEEIKT